MSVLSVVRFRSPSLLGFKIGNCKRENYFPPQTTNEKIPLKEQDYLSRRLSFSSYVHFGGPYIGIVCIDIENKNLTFTTQFSLTLDDVTVGQARLGNSISSVLKHFPLVVWMEALTEVS